MSKNVTFYKLFINTVIYDQRELMNLIIVSTLFTYYIMKCYIECKLDCTSNHQIICITIKYGRHYKSQKTDGRFELNQIKEKKFVLYLKRQKDLVKTKLAKTRQESFLCNEKVKTLNKIAK